MAIRNILALNTTLSRWETQQGSDTLQIRGDAAPVFQVVNTSEVSAFSVDTVAMLVTVPAIAISGALPALDFYDTDCDDTDINAQIYANATTLTTGAEDVDLSMWQQIGGTLSRTYFSDADQGIWLYPLGETANPVSITTGGVLNVPNKLNVTLSDAVTNAVTYAQRISHVSSGTVLAGFGTGIEFELEENDGTNRVAATIDVVWTDAGQGTNADAKMVFNLMQNDGAAAEKGRIESNGDFYTQGDIILPALKYIYFDGAGDTRIHQSAVDVISLEVGGVEALTIKEATNIVVGIQNAAPEAWHPAQTALQMGGLGALWSTTAQAASSGIKLSNNAYYDSVDSRYEYILIDEASIYEQVNGAHYFKVAPVGGAPDAAISWQTALTLDNSGNVTIGALTDNVTPIFSIIADADSDGAATTSETIALTLTANADPTLATWGFTSTQSAGYTFDKTLDVTGAFTAGSIASDAGFGMAGLGAQAQKSHLADPTGGATVDAEARTAINAILVTLETYGFHATS